MRSYTVTSTLSLFITSISALQIPSIFADFLEPHLDDTSSLLTDSKSSSTPNKQQDLLKRDGSCPLNYNSCSTLALADAAACCTVGSFCTTDRARNIACCPIGAVCTGTLGKTSAPSAATAGGLVFASVTTTSTLNPSAAAPTITTPASVVNNIYFPFPYIPTTYPNSASCNSAFNDCQSNYAACTQDLQGGGFAVTVVAPNGGMTVSPTAMNLGLASATSICSSLSMQACYGIVSANCAQFAQQTGFIVATPTRNEAPKRTAVGMVAVGGVMAGLGVGIVGQMI